jgi:prepilin-type N-terminal cleavage/methylation domain-containing protein
VRTRGFTLIELMISMALFGLIAAGAMTLVISGARTQSHSARVDVAQTSLRTAIDFITRDVMGAGAGSNGGSLTLSGGTLVNAIAFDTTANNIVSTSPYVDHSDRLELYNVDGTTLAQLSSNVAGNATTLPITYEGSGSGSTGRFAAQSTPYQSYVQVFDPNAKLAAVVSMTSASGTALTVSSVPTAFSAYAGYVVPSRHVTYFVSNQQFTSTATSNASMLMMSLNGSTNINNAEPLAEGVADMQIAYGFDTNGDGIITETTPTPSANDDEWLYNCANETPTAQMVIGNLRSVRVTLVVKSTSVDTGQQNMPVRPAAEDNAAATTQDGFIRRVLRTEIAVRNFNQ